MPEFAQFVALGDTDTAFRADGRKFTFDLADFDVQHNVVLMFKVSGPRNAKLQMDVNAQLLAIDFELDSSFTEPRSWHEIVTGGVFGALKNSLTVQGIEGDGGTLPAVSDIVILYHAKTA